MLETLSLPGGVSFVRTTPAFTSTSLPAGLLAAHRVAEEVWGLLCVEEGAVTFVLEESGASRRVTAGERQVIEPDVLHHVEPEPDAVFRVEFYRY